MKSGLGFPKLRHVGVGSWGRGIGERREQGHAGMEPIVGEERGESGSRVFGVIIREFRHGEEAGPVGLLAVAVDSQVLLEDGVEPLCLAICLGMEGGRPVGTDSQKFDESSQEVGGEDRVSVADHSFGQAMKPYDVLDEERRDVLRRHGFCGWNEVRHLGEAIDDH